MNARAEFSIEPTVGGPRATPSRDHLEAPAPAGHPTCAARQLLGTRVCDLAPHTTPRHVGAGPTDPRGEFWAAR